MSYLLPGRSPEYYSNASPAARLPVGLLAMVAIALAVIIGGSVYGLRRGDHRLSLEPAPSPATAPPKTGIEESLPPDFRTDLAAHARSTEHYLNGCLGEIDAAEKELNKFRDVHADSSIDRSIERLQAARRDAVRAREQSTTVRALSQGELGRAH